ncbi:hypothetical protein NA78x_001419 [Anatilimnocola sp. NA78]|uniref:hypothetical protein n=1 Tax=Anatilimnocola sp. NA78 TaxID=3415683 RepID=UPI003CE50179
MPFTRFLRQLFDHGRVTVPAQASLQVDERELGSLLLDVDQSYRRHLPAEMPPLDLASAAQGALLLYRCAQLLAQRDLGMTELENLLAATAENPSEPTPTEHYSSDLCLRFLPDLIRLARAAAVNDPLVACLLEVGRRWPLSSVGINEIVLDEMGHARVRQLATHPALFQLYVDRVLQTGDATRLCEPLVRRSARTAVGAYPELGGKLKKELEAPPSITVISNTP